MKTIELITPCYNEEKCIEEFANEVERVFNELIPDYAYIITYVDDGSLDGTLKEIKRVTSERKKGVVRYISFSRNFGKEAAILAGLKNCIGDYVALLDVDLQHPIELIPTMIDAIEKEGYDCATAQRVSRTGEKKVRSFLSQRFYSAFNQITGMRLAPGGTDYRLMRREVAKALTSITETERFTKGLYSWVGFKNKWIQYNNVERVNGNTKWSTRGLIKYALTGFFSFATTPLRGVVYLGMLTVLISIVWSIRMLISAAFFGTNGSGFLTLLLVILFLGGVIITILGVIGEYLARIYMEVKDRPIYIERESNLDDTSV